MIIWKLFGIHHDNVLDFSAHCCDCDVIWNDHEMMKKMHPIGTPCCMGIFVVLMMLNIDKMLMINVICAKENVSSSWYSGTQNKWWYCFLFLSLFEMNEQLSTPSHTTYLSPSERQMQPLGSWQLGPGWGGRRGASCSLSSRAAPPSCWLSTPLRERDHGHSPGSTSPFLVTFR